MVEIEIEREIERERAGVKHTSELRERVEKIKKERREDIV
jgi:hypothetical protein